MDFFGGILSDSESNASNGSNEYLQAEKRFPVLVSAPLVMLTAVSDQELPGIVVLTDSSADPGHTLSTLAIWVSARIRGHCAPRAAGGGAQLGAKLRSFLNDAFVFRSQLRAYGQATLGLASEFSDHVGSPRELVFEASRNVTRVGSGTLVV